MPLSKLVPKVWDGFQVLAIYLQHRRSCVSVVPDAKGTPRKGCPFRKAERLIPQIAPQGISSVSFGCQLQSIKHMADAQVMDTVGPVAHSDGILSLCFPP